MYGRSKLENSRWILMPLGRTHTQTCTHNNITDESNFQKPGTQLV